jgi:hypothetical protein
LRSRRLRQESDAQGRIVVQPEGQQAQAELKQAEITAVGAMHQPTPAGLRRQGAQVGDLPIGQARGNTGNCAAPKGQARCRFRQAAQALGISTMTLMEMKAWLFWSENNVSINIRFW